MRSIGQGSLEYLLILGGGAVLSLLVIGGILQLASIPTEGNAEAFANARCASVEQTLCDARQQMVMDDKTFTCFWSNTENQCLAQVVQESNPICGNGEIELGEVCDRTNVDDETCESQGFSGGVLRCAEDCQTFNVTDCLVCGNNQKEGIEVCDGRDFGGLSCADFGLTESETGLQCLNQCSVIESSSCGPPIGDPDCGNEIVETPEHCDGNNLNGQDCMTLGSGFSGGTLRCYPLEHTQACQFNTEACENNEEQLLGSLPQLFGMQMQSITKNRAEKRVTVLTTGGKFVLSWEGATEDISRIELFSRINTETNQPFVPGQELLVGRLVFAQGIGAVVNASAVSPIPDAIEPWDASSAKLETTRSTIIFNAESFFTIQPKNGQIIRYSYQSLLPNTEWQKQGKYWEWSEGSHATVESDFADRQWAGPTGGSMHVQLKGRNSGEIVQNYSNNETVIELRENDWMGHMVFPSKPFSFEQLYASDAKPFLFFVLSGSQLEWTINNLDSLSASRFGTIILFEGLYVNGASQEACGYVINPELQSNGKAIYRYSDPSRVRALIDAAHSRGLKVVSYFGVAAFSAPCDVGDYHRVASTKEEILRWANGFQNEYGLDGWYFDNAAVIQNIIFADSPNSYGDVQSVLDTYAFVREIRKQVGDGGIMVHHDSVDVVGIQSGLSAVMVDSFVTYRFTGEVGAVSMVNDPNDLRLRYYSSGYGLSQAICFRKQASDPQMVMTIPEHARVLWESLNCSGSEDFANQYQFPDSQKFDYLSRAYAQGKQRVDRGRLIDYPVSWFSSANNVSVLDNGNGTVTVSWQTPVASDSEVAFSRSNHWYASYGRFGPEGLVRKNELVQSHSVIVSNLEPNVTYYYRVRSRQGNGLSETIWGANGTFRVTTAFSSECPLANCSGLLGFWPMDRGPWNTATVNNHGLLEGARWEPSVSLWNNSSGPAIRLNSTPPTDGHPSEFHAGLMKTGNSFSNPANYLQDDPTTHAFSFTAWIKPTSVTGIRRIARNYGSLLEISIVNGNVVLVPYSSTREYGWVTVSDFSIAVNQWTHLAVMVMENATGVGYTVCVTPAGGETQCSPTAGYAPITTPGVEFGPASNNPDDTYFRSWYSHLGDFAVDGSFDGWIDDVSLWKRIVSLDEIESLAGR